MATLEALLHEGVVICDGAMGTLLQRHGIPSTYPYEYANLTHANLIQSLHREYVAAGARIIETNTYGANRFKLAGPGMAGRVAEINLAAARNARAAVPEGVLVAGAIGPAGKPLKPMGVIDPGDARQAVLEQAAALLEGGVDLFVLETFVDLDELKLAVDAVRSLTRLPIVAHKTFIEDADALAEGVAQRAVATMLGWDVQVVGANCTVGPQRMLHILRGMAEAAGDRPLSVMPTPGLPLLVEGRIQYEAAPEYFAQYGRLFAEAGARMIGCCGTTPDHIRAMAGAAPRRPPPGHGDARGPRRAGSAARCPRTVDLRPQARPEVCLHGGAGPAAGAGNVQGLRGGRAAQGPWVRLHRHLGRRAGAPAHEPHGGQHPDPAAGGHRGDDALLLPGPEPAGHPVGPAGGPRPGPAQHPGHHGGPGPDRGLPGGHLGVRRGFHRPGARAAAVQRRAGHGRHTIKESTAFLIAVGFNPLAPDSAKELDRLKAKVDEGAQLIYTQPIYERHVLDFAAIYCRAPYRSSQGHGPATDP